jgi:hypothetical protein
MTSKAGTEIDVIALDGGEPCLFPRLRPGVAGQGTRRRICLRERGGGLEGRSTEDYACIVCAYAAPRFQLQ